MRGQLCAERVGFLIAGLSAIIFVSDAMAGEQLSLAPISISSAPFTTYFSLPRFNPAAGTLTSATLTYSATITPTLIVQAIVGGGGGTFTAGTATLPVQFTGIPGYDGHFSGTESPVSGTVAPNATDTYPGSPTTPGEIVYNISPSNFSTFIGTGSFSLEYASGSPTAGGTTTDELDFSGIGSASGEATIDYIYGPTVPEPTSVCLVAASATVLMVRRPRRS